MKNATKKNEINSGIEQASKARVSNSPAALSFSIISSTTFN